MNLALRLCARPPVALQKTQLLPGNRVCWTLEATFPAPYGTVYARFSEPAQGDDCLEILTPTGVLLQRLVGVSLMASAPGGLEARWLSPALHKGPLLVFHQTYPDHDAPTPHFVAFPDGFSRLCTLSKQWRPEKPVHWNGIGFVEGGQRGEPAAEDVSVPVFLPPSRTGAQTRFAAAAFGGRVFLLRWTRSRGKVVLEILDSQGRALVRHRLKDDFGADRATTIGADWLDEKRQRGPVLIARDSDQVRVHVFTEGFRKLLCAQDFNDSSTSIYATTVQFDRDRRGLLTVAEAYSERGDGDQPGASHTTSYVWTGRGFDER